MPSKLFWRQGFTLLELLIVILIIGLLTTIIVIGLTQGPRRARDALRKSDLRNVKNALETYYQDNNNQYPNPAGANGFTRYNNLAGATFLPNQTPRIGCDPLTGPRSGIPPGTCTDDAVNPQLEYRYSFAANRSSYRLCATLENTLDQEGGSGAQDGYVVMSVNGTAPLTCT